MATQRQIAANRRNAVNSTGPKTPEGKLIVAKNAIKHGLFVDGLLLDEDPESFARFKAATFDELCPEGVIECSLAERMTWEMWRMRRTPRLEAGAHIWRQYGTDWSSMVVSTKPTFAKMSQ